MKLSTDADVREALDELAAMLDGSMPRLDLIDEYLQGEHKPPFTPREANREYRQLLSKAKTNWLQLVLAAPAQALYVDGYRSSGESENARPWTWWQANGLDARQAAVYRAAMGYGVCYTLSTQGEDPLTGAVTPHIRGVSPRRMVAAYADPHDDWAEAALHVVDRTDDSWTVDLYDEAAVWSVTADKGDGGKWRIVSIEAADHGARVVPVVRFPDLPDLEGRHPGMIEPLIPVQDRINQTTFDTLMTQTFASFMVRTISGMTILDAHDDQADDLTAAERETAREAKLRLAQDRFLVAEDPDTKFGSLPASPLKPFIDAQEANVRHLAAVSQTPPHHLLGQMANLSAEALVAAETSLSRKVTERKAQFGEAWEQTLRLAAHIAGDGDAASDMSAEVQWRDHEARSLAATVDALGKAVSNLGVPPEGLWDRIPGVTNQEIERWKKLRSAGDALSMLEAELQRQADGVTVDDS